MHLFAPVKCDAYPWLDGIVLFELEDTEGKISWLEIRYKSYVAKQIEGDHIHLDSFEEAKRYIERVYGVAPHSWRSLTSDEIDSVNASIK